MAFHDVRSIVHAPTLDEAALAQALDAIPEPEREEAERYAFEVAKLSPCAVCTTLGAAWEQERSWSCPRCQRRGFVKQEARDERDASDPLLVFLGTLTRDEVALLMSPVDWGAEMEASASSLPSKTGLMGEVMEAVEQGGGLSALAEQMMLQLLSSEDWRENAEATPLREKLVIYEIDEPSSPQFEDFFIESILIGPGHYIFWESDALTLSDLARGDRYVERGRYEVAHLCVFEEQFMAFLKTESGWRCWSLGL